MTKLLVISDCTVLGLGFERLATEDPDIEYLGIATAADGLRVLESDEPDVVVLDYANAGGKAVVLCETISKRRPMLPILILSDVLDDDAVRASIEAGARGYIYKNADSFCLRSAIGWLAKGHAVLDPKVTKRVIEWATQSTLETTEEGLSSREIEVLRLVSRGEPNKRIAKRMGLTENTVKTYLRRAYRKLDCHTRSQAAAAMARKGLL